MNGYTKITINGGEAGLKFAHLSNKLFFEAMAQNAQYYTDSTGFNEIGWAKLLHCAYINHCVIREEKQTLTLADFVEWVEGVSGNEQRTKEFTQAAEVWSEAQSTKDILEKISQVSAPPEEGKRKKKGVKVTGQS